MRRVHPLRALGSSRWRTRAALAVLVTGMIVGPLGNRPAEAHGDFVHTVIVRGHMHITDIDNLFPEFCDFDVTQSASFQRTSSNPNPKASVQISKTCDKEVTGILRVNVAWTPDTTSPHVLSDGFARVTDTFCVIGKPFCSTKPIVPDRPYSAFFLERTTEQRLTVEMGSADKGFVAFDFEVVII